MTSFHKLMDYLNKRKNTRFKKKIFIVTKSQFGYYTDGYKYAIHLKDLFDIHYLCFDTGDIKIFEKGVKVHYISLSGSFLSKGKRFLDSVIDTISRENPDAVLVNYFPGSSIIPLKLKTKKIILDIRTGSVSSSIIRRFFYNKTMELEALFFNHITVLSESLSNRLNIKKKRIHILPLGADAISCSKKNFKTIKLLYVGTLNSRNIPDTIIGCYQFLSLNPTIEFSYDIFGDGTEEEINKINNTITTFKLSTYVKYHGRKTHEELKPYFDTCNIGISYIPKTKYYDCQPPTKTFEYINSGLFCIATSTSENRKLINKSNGILCEDNPQSFADALQSLKLKKEHLNSEIISKTLEYSSWETIVRKNLFNYLQNL